MINYTEKGIGLHDRIAQLGLPALEFRDGAWWHPDPDAVQPVIDGYTLADAVALMIPRVKALAREKILAFLPDWQQSNFNARMNELNEVRFTRALTEAEQGDVDAMRAAWDAAKAIRAASNVHEANLAALDSFAAINGYDLTAGWPTP